MRSKQIIKKNYEFNRVYKKGKPCHGAQLSLFLFKRWDHGPARYAVTVSRRIKGAVQRNRVKRVLRALWWEYAEEVRDSYDIIILGKTEAKPGSYAQLKAQYRKLLAKAELLQESPEQCLPREAAEEEFSGSRPETSDEKLVATAPNLGEGRPGISGKVETGTSAAEANRS